MSISLYLKKNELNILQYCLYSCRSVKPIYDLNRSSIISGYAWSVGLSGYSASSTTKTDRHDIAEILLKVALKHQKSISQSNMLSRALLEWLYWSCSNRPLKKPTMCRCLETLRKKSFEDTKVVIRSRNSKDRQNNGQQKSTNNDV